MTTLEQLKDLSTKPHVMVNINTLESAVLNDTQKKFVSELRAQLVELYGDRARMVGMTAAMISHIISLSD